jgi:type III pantothenate kinase
VTLLVDVGNSAVKWAVVDAGGSFGASGRVLHRDGSDLAAALTAGWRAIGTAARAVGCSVAAPPVAAAVDEAARSLGLPPVTWVRAQAAFDGSGVALVNGYADPAQLGADRWHALLGACARAPGCALVVANAGTATTVDCVRVDGHGARFVGGCIAPGVRLMLESLARGTAGLPLAQGAPADFPDSTDSAIVTGVFDAQAGLVERVWRRLAAATGSAPRLLLAGGHAEALAARVAPECAPSIDHNLVLRGLALRASAP